MVSAQVSAECRFNLQKLITSAKNLRTERTSHCGAMILCTFFLDDFATIKGACVLCAYNPQSQIQYVRSVDRKSRVCQQQTEGLLGRVVCVYLLNTLKTLAHGLEMRFNGPHKPPLPAPFYLRRHCPTPAALIGKHLALTSSVLWEFGIVVVCRDEIVYIVRNQRKLTSCCGLIISGDRLYLPFIALCFCIYFYVSQIMPSAGGARHAAQLVRVPGQRTSWQQTAGPATELQTEMLPFWSWEHHTPHALCHMV